MGVTRLWVNNKVNLETFFASTEHLAKKHGLRLRCLMLEPCGCVLVTWKCSSVPVMDITLSRIIGAISQLLKGLTIDIPINNPNCTPKYPQ